MVKTEFKQFDVLNDEPTDHHYLAKTGKVDESTSLHIMKEWKILKKSLPEHIYIQVYQDRIDLLRAVIVGPVGTPYHDGLFFFDMFLPSDYPNNPPEVYYHSFGYRLNPNLYENGYVCLSLINTWSGSEDEKWRGKESTILQLLVSIQGLVLNERPYFNEPGHASGKTSIDGNVVHASNMYSENTFILSCKTMLQIMKKPPQGFDSFVAWHFKERSGLILDAVSAYAEGRRVPCGMFQSDGESLSSSFVEVSETFKKDLGKISPELALAFDKFGELEKLEKGTEAKVDGTKKRKRDKIAKKPKKGKHGEDGKSNKKAKTHGKDVKSNKKGKHGEDGKSNNKKAKKHAKKKKKTGL